MPKILSIWTFAELDVFITIMKYLHAVIGILLRWRYLKENVPKFLKSLQWPSGEYVLKSCTSFLKSDDTFGQDCSMGINVKKWGSK